MEDVTMDMNLVDLAGFELKKQDVLREDSFSQLTRAEFTQGLIVVTEVNPHTQQIKLHANYEWQQNENGKWVPDLKHENANFNDPLTD